MLISTSTTVSTVLLETTLQNPIQTTVPTQALRITSMQEPTAEYSHKQVRKVFF